VGLVGGEVGEVKGWLLALRFVIDNGKKISNNQDMKIRGAANWS